MGQSRTLSVKQMRRELRLAEEELTAEAEDELLEEQRLAVEAVRPKTRADCENGPRPCPFVSCRWNLYLDVTEHGSIKFNFPGKELWELPATCALDLAERGGMTLEEVGDAMQLTRERVRQVEAAAMARMGKRLDG